MFFIPRSSQREFFSLFTGLSSLIIKIGDLLFDLKIGSKTISSYTKRARKIELSADKICHQIYSLTNQTFLPPFDRDDIYLLAKSLDNLVDLTENLISNFELYQPKKEIAVYRQFISLIDKTFKKVSLLIEELNNEKKIEVMKKLIGEINQLESQGDLLIKEGLKWLFSNHKKPLIIIQWKDLLENMEEILDEGEDVAFIIEQVLVKNF